MKFHPEMTIYGNTSYRGKCPPESAEQITFFNTLARRHPEVAKIAVHPRNEGKRTMRQAQAHKAEGMNPGASDIIIPGSPALVIELKRLDHTKSRWQPGQIDYLLAAKEAGATVCVALGAEAALDAVQDWLSR